MLPPFQVRNLRGAVVASDSTPSPVEGDNIQSSHGTVQITAPFYDNLIGDHPEAVLQYMDDDDGEIITVGSSNELSQRLEEPVGPAPRQPRSRPSRRRSGRAASGAGISISSPYHMFDVDRSSSKALGLWRELEQATRPSTSAWPKDMARDMGKVLHDEEIEASKEEKPGPQADSKIEIDVSDDMTRLQELQRDHSSDRLRYYKATNPPQAELWTRPALGDYYTTVLQDNASLLHGFNTGLQQIKPAGQNAQSLADIKGLTEEGKRQAAAAGARLRSTLGPLQSTAPLNYGNAEAYDRWAAYGKTPSTSSVEPQSSLFGAFQDQIQKVQAVSALNNAAEKATQPAAATAPFTEPQELQQNTMNPGEIFANTIRSIVEGANLFANDLRESLPEVREAVKSGSQEVSQSLEESLRGAFDVFSTHIQTVAQDASVFAREAADRTREADTQGLETVIDGLGKVAAGFGQIGRDIFAPRRQSPECEQQQSSNELKIDTRTAEQPQELSTSISNIHNRTPCPEDPKPEVTPLETRAFDIEYNDEFSAHKQQGYCPIPRGPHDRSSLFHRRSGSPLCSRPRRAVSVQSHTERLADTAHGRVSRRHTAFPYRGYEYVNPSDVDLDRHLGTKPAHPIRRRYHARSRSPRLRSSPGRSVSPLLGGHKYGKHGPIHLPNDPPSPVSPFSGKQPERGTAEANGRGRRTLSPVSFKWARPSLSRMQPSDSRPQGLFSEAANENKTKSTGGPAASPLVLHVEKTSGGASKYGNPATVPRSLRHRQSWHPSTKHSTPSGYEDWTDPRALEKKEAFDPVAPRVPPKIKHAHSFYNSGSDYAYKSPHSFQVRDRSPYVPYSFSQSASKGTDPQNFFDEDWENDIQPSERIKATFPFSRHSTTTLKTGPQISASHQKPAIDVFQFETLDKESELASSQGELPLRSSETASRQGDENTPQILHHQRNYDNDPFDELPHFPSLSQFEERTPQVAPLSSLPSLLPEVRNSEPVGNNASSEKAAGSSKDSPEAGLAPAWPAPLSDPWSLTNLNKAPSALSSTSDDQDLYGLEAGYNPPLTFSYGLPTTLHTSPSSPPISSLKPDSINSAPSLVAGKSFDTTKSQESALGTGWESFLERYENTPGSFPSERSVPTTSSSSRGNAREYERSAPEQRQPPAPRRSHSERSVRFDDQPPAIINDNFEISALHSHEDASSVQKVGQCADNLRQMGFGKNANGETDMDRLVVYAQAAEGDLETALEIIDEETQVLHQRTSSS
ncbi:MAG: hypothetical protein M1814_002561 [Vezdaea aestivalis]|nr:MAG: hypothetical protein M1814_002561 [Vezdaea aestivalis]